MQPFEQLRWLVLFSFASSTSINVYDLLILIMHNRCLDAYLRQLSKGMYIYIHRYFNHGWFQNALAYIVWLVLNQKWLVLRCKTHQNILIMFLAYCFLLNTIYYILISLVSFKRVVREKYRKEISEYSGNGRFETNQTKMRRSIANVSKKETNQTNQMGPLMSINITGFPNRHEILPNPPFGNLGLGSRCMLEC
jgi:hypothetical protein